MTQNWVSTSTDKVTAVNNYPTPYNVRDVRAFVGLASFHRRLVPNFAELARPLTTLTRKTQEFTWGSESAKSFRKLKGFVVYGNRACLSRFYAAVYSGY